jgi:hypothetical protein
MDNQYNIKDAQLQGRNIQSRKIANNTYLLRQGDDIVLRLHETNVITYKSNGDIILNSGGWFTSTTKDRINSGILPYFTLVQNKSIWYLVKRLNGDTYDGNNTRYRFKDGITIKWTGKVINADNMKNETKDAKVKAKIKAYAKLCASRIPLDKPSGGDCWYCYMQTEDGKNLGDAVKDNDHLQSHLKEKYVVPSLVYNALKEKYNAPMAFSEAFIQGDYNREFGKMAVTKAVYRYIASRLGYAV